MKKAWLQVIATVFAIFIATTMSNSAMAASKTSIEQTNYEDFYFGTAIFFLVVAVFTFFFRAKKYKKDLNS